MGYLTMKNGKLRKGAGMETYLTIEGVAGHLKLSAQTIRRYVLNREIPFHKIKKVIRFRLSEIEAWVDGGGLDGKVTPGAEEILEGDLFAGVEAAEAGVADGEGAETETEGQGGAETDKAGTDEAGEDTEHNGTAPDWGEGGNDEVQIF
jgi:excisionase family DNA binding protein